MLFDLLELGQHGAEGLLVFQKRVAGVERRQAGHAALDVVEDLGIEIGFGDELLVTGEGDDGGDGNAGTLDDDGLVSLVDLGQELVKAGAGCIGVEVDGCGHGEHRRKTGRQRGRPVQVLVTAGEAQYQALPGWFHLAW